VAETRRRIRPAVHPHAIGCPEKEIDDEMSAVLHCITL